MMKPGPGIGSGPVRAGGDERRRRHMRALQRARHPHRLARQPRRERGEGRGLALHVAGKIGLAVAAALIAGHRRVPHPPPARHYAHAAAASSIAASPPCSIAPSTSPV